MVLVWIFQVPYNVLQGYIYPKKTKMNFKVLFYYLNKISPYTHTLTITLLQRFKKKRHDSHFPPSD